MIHTIFSDDASCFYYSIPNQMVQEYLVSYAKLHDLYPRIRFNDPVTQCMKHDTPNAATTATPSTNTTTAAAGWRILTKSGRIKYESRNLVICSGHYRKKFQPNVVGLEQNFRPSNMVMHSSSFDQYPLSKFKGKIVLIVGGNISGESIANQLLAPELGVGKVIVSYRDFTKSRVYPFLAKKILKEGGNLAKGIKEVREGNMVHFHDPDLVDKKDHEIWTSFITTPC